MFLYVYMLQFNVINNLTKDCNLEIVKCSLTGINCTKLNMSSVTSFVRVIIIQLRINTRIFKDETHVFLYFCKLTMYYLLHKS